MVPGKCPNLQGELVRCGDPKRADGLLPVQVQRLENQESWLCSCCLKGGLAQDPGRASVSESAGRKADVTPWKQKEFIISYSEKDWPSSLSVQTFNRLAEATPVREGQSAYSVCVLMLAPPETPPTGTVRMTFDQISVHRMARSSWHRKLTITAEVVNLVSCPSCLLWLPWGLCAEFTKCMEGKARDQSSENR